MLPRPGRLRLKRRDASSLSFNAPTSQFLASVAAADNPLPTIEIADTDMLDVLPRAVNGDFLSTRSKLRGNLTPRTPVPELPEVVSTNQFPDWSRDTPSPAPELFERPTSSRSTTSDFSEDSYYSVGHLSRPSESTCTSPDAELPDPFSSPSSSRSKAKRPRESVNMSSTISGLMSDKITLNHSMRSKFRPDVGWTKAQTTHLWSTYMQYLQDPTLTPFRFGATCVPPDGVVHRVARQAKRSWKGPQSPTVQSTFSPSRGGSNTPTQQAIAYSSWPHSKAATRNHLKELCKLRSTTAVHCHRHRQSRSTTPFTKLSKYDADAGPFATNDIALSLTTSVSETMQPNGPLAQLALEPSPPPTADLFGSKLQPAFEQEQDDLPYRSLADPWAQSYGPSSSRLLAVASGHKSPPLRSPITFSHSRSLSNTQKRSAHFDLEAEMDASRYTRRPSILNDQLFGPQAERRKVRARGFSLGDELLRARGTEPPWNPLAELSRDELDSGFSTVSSSSTMSRAALSERFGPPPRLRSPFESSTNSNTFPRVHFQEKTTAARRAPYATHRPRRSIESYDFGPSLRSRLSQVDTGLQEIREREEQGRQDQA